MTLDELQAYSAVAQTVLAFLTLIVTAALTYLVYRGTKNIAAIEYSRSIRDAWLAFDSVALASDDMLIVADKLMDASTAGNPIELRRKRWLTFMVLNIMTSTFEGRKYKFVKHEDAKAAFDRLLMPIVIDDDAFPLTQSKGHPPDFSIYCKNLRDGHHS